MAKWQWILKQLGGKLWLRAGLFCVLAVLTALVALILKNFIPSDISRKVGAEAVDNILQIIASSMLAVTTFSLSTMVAAYSAATSNVTPRATQLLLRDSTAQNALSVFIGAFIFSLVGIIALSMEVYGDSGRLVLFIVTVAVIVLIIGVLLQWISYLSRLGRVNETIDTVEHVAARALQNRIDSPYLGGVALHDYTPAAGHYAVQCGQIGYIQHIDMRALSEFAARIKAEFFFCTAPGAFNDGVKPLFYSSVRMDEKNICTACDAYTIADSRSFEQDPRFGVAVLAEIASRALSPAMNDPGTAIDILGTSVRLLAPWVSRSTPDPEPQYANLHVPPLLPADVFDDIYAPIIRDSAGNLQVAIRLQKALLSLSRMGNRDAAMEAVKLSRYALAYANETLLIQRDKDIIAALAERVKES